MPYELHYWPQAQGRGEFVRLALEEAGANYVDVAREDGKGKGVPAMLEMMNGKKIARPPFAPPFLRDGKVMVGQTSAILLYLGPRIGLAPKSEADRLWVHQIQLTIADVVDELHNTHHPLGPEYYYEDQKAEAKRNAEQFRRSRLPKYFDWFETVLARNAGGKFLVGRRLSYADTSLFQLIEALTYSFPKTMRKVLKAHPRVAALHRTVAARPRISKYMSSERRIAGNEKGTYRHYPELDG
jgi:glutathione S-transferase